MIDDAPGNVCPKCGFVTQNPEVCDACGALLSRMRSREFIEAEINQDPRAHYAPPPPAEEPAPRPWLTIIAIFVLLIATGFGIYYIKTSNAKKQQATLDEEISSVAEGGKQAGPVADPDPLETAPKAETETPVAAVQDTPVAKTPLPPVDVPKVPLTTNATPVVNEKALDWLSNLKPAGKAAATPAPGVKATPSPSPTVSGPVTAAGPAVTRKETRPKSINLGEEVFADQSDPDKQASNLMEKLEANNQTPADEQTPEQEAPSEILAVNADNFSDEVLGLSDEPVLVTFWSPNSDQSKALVPAIQSLSQNYAGKVKFVQVQAEENRDLLRRYKVQGVPTVILFKRGREVERREGALPPEMLKVAIDPHVKK